MGEIESIEAKDPAQQAAQDFHHAAQAAEASFQDAAAESDAAPLTLEAEQNRAIILGLRAHSLLLQNLILTLEVIQEERVDSTAAEPQPSMADQESNGGERWRLPADNNLVRLHVENRRRFFTSSEAANYLGVSLATVRRWNDAGHIEASRTPGGQRRFSREILDEFLGRMASQASSHRSA